MTYSLCQISLEVLDIITCPMFMKKYKRYGQHEESQTSGNIKDFIDQYVFPLTWGGMRFCRHIRMILNLLEKISPVCCFVLLKLNFKLPEIETLLPIHLIKKFPLREKHATKGGQRLQAGEGQEERQRQGQHRLLLLPRRSTDRMFRRCLLLWWRLLLWWQRLWW